MQSEKLESRGDSQEAFSLVACSAGMCLLPQGSGAAVSGRVLTGLGQAGHLTAVVGSSLNP